MFLHFGVVSLASQFSLEFVGYNLADFATPDERGRKAKNEVIDPKEGPSLRTSLPLDLLRAQLVPTSKKVHLSTEPGRFIGNWVYFHSLQWIKQQQQAALGSTSRDVRTSLLGCVDPHISNCLLVDCPPVVVMHSLRRWYCTCRRSRRSRWTSSSASSGG